MGKIPKPEHNDRRELIHLLHDIQEKHGYIPPEAIFVIARKLRITESEIYGVLTFYKGFSLTPRGKHLVTICMGTACHVRGAPKILDEFIRRLNIEPGKTTEDKQFTLETVNCVGACALGPIAITDGKYQGQLKTMDVAKLVDGIRDGDAEGS